MGNLSNILSENMKERDCFEDTGLDRRIIFLLFIFNRARNVSAQWLSLRMIGEWLSNKVFKQICRNLLENQDSHFPVETGENH